MPHYHVVIFRVIPPCTNSPGSILARNPRPETAIRVNVSKLVAEALEIEAQAAKEAGALGYMARVLVQATMPHKNTPGAEFKRSNGIFTLTILSPSEVGLPYGTYPRLLLAWLTSEAVKTRKPEVVLGPTLSGFMNELGLIPAGGRWGTISRLKDQMKRLFSSYVSFRVESDMENLGVGFPVAFKYHLWWDPKSPDQAALWLSTVTLSYDFFNEIVDRPVPIDMRALKALKRSPLALDIYCWLTYRMSYLNRKTEIPWEALITQFGVGYPYTKLGVRHFKSKFLYHLRKVLVVYPAAKVDDGTYGLLLRPSKPHIPLLPSA